MTAPVVSIKKITKSYGATPVLTGIDFSLQAGSITTLLGPSGCGKTTLLRIIAGFERPDSGSVEILGRRVVDVDSWVPPHRRGIGYVPQEGALFPHLSVAGNIGFGLDKIGRMAGKIEQLLELIGLSGLGSRMPHELSGGQQQRVALARALANTPAIVLLDEPFNALDAHLRRALCADVRHIIHQSGAAAILVTHDRDEAFSLADRIAVIRGGQVVQSGVPADLYSNPGDIDTAQLVGSTLCLSATLAGGRALTSLGSLAVRNPGHVADGPVTVMLRPEQIVPTETGAGLVVRVKRAAAVGPLTWLDLVQTTHGVEFMFPACWLAATPPVIGSTLEVRVAGDALVFPKRSMRD